MPRLESQPFGDYVLHDRIGCGGMAEIFLAAHSRGPRSHVVIKRILPTLSEDTQFVRMFVEEAKLCVKLDHPNIVKVLELGELEHQHYIAMEYVDGRDLLKTLAACGKKRIGFPTDIALFIVMELLRGLGYAHALTGSDGRSLDIIHRDVSPSNILLAFDGTVKIGDFGIAKATTREKTATGILKGKFGYMAPEQVSGTVIDHRADIFAAGIVLCELLTGHRVFAGKSDLAVLERVRDAIIEPPPRHFRPDLSPELERIVMKALARRPEDRYPRAEDFLGDLESYVERSAAEVGPHPLGRFLRGLFLRSPEERERRERVGLPAVGGRAPVDLDTAALPAAAVAAASMLEDEPVTEAQLGDTLLGLPPTFESASEEPLEHDHTMNELTMNELPLPDDLPTTQFTGSEMEAIRRRLDGPQVFEDPADPILSNPREVTSFGLLVDDPSTGIRLGSELSLELDDPEPEKTRFGALDGGRSPSFPEPPAGWPETTNALGGDALTQSLSPDDAALAKLLPDPRMGRWSEEHDATSLGRLTSEPSPEPLASSADELDLGLEDDFPPELESGALEPIVPGPTLPSEATAPELPEAKGLPRVSLSEVVRRIRPIRERNRARPAEPSLATPSPETLDVVPGTPNSVLARETTSGGEGPVWEDRRFTIVAVFAAVLALLPASLIMAFSGGSSESEGPAQETTVATLPSPASSSIPSAGPNPAEVQASDPTAPASTGGRPSPTDAKPIEAAALGTSRPGPPPLKAAGDATPAPAETRSVEAAAPKPATPLAAAPPRPAPEPRTSPRPAPKPQTAPRPAPKRAPAEARPGRREAEAPRKRGATLQIRCATAVELHLRGHGRFTLAGGGARFEKKLPPGGYVATFVRDGRIVDRRSVRLLAGGSVELPCP